MSRWHWIEWAAGVVMLLPLATTVASRTRGAPSLALPLFALAVGLGTVAGWQRWRLRGVGALALGAALAWLWLGRIFPPLGLILADLQQLRSRLAGLEGPPSAALDWATSALTAWLGQLVSNPAAQASLGWHLGLLVMVMGSLWWLLATRAAVPRAANAPPAWPIMLLPTLALGFSNYGLKGAEERLFWFLSGAIALGLLREGIRHDARWVALRFPYSGEILKEHLMIAAFIGGSAAGLGWSSQVLLDPRLSGPVVQLFARPWQLADTFSGGRLSEIVHATPLPTESSLPVRQPAHALSGARTITPVPIMAVTVPDLPTPRNLRWRGQVLDEYTGRGWRTSVPRQRTIPAAWGTPGPGLQQIVQLAPDQPIPDLLAGPGIVWTDGARSEISNGAGDVSAFPIRSTRYTVVSAEGSGTPAEPLSAAQRARYTQLPPTLPLRVRLLASMLAGPRSDASAVAARLEAAVEVLPYTTNIPSPPEGRDPVDWFLFDLRRGYCDYYASAFVLLARAVGLPARLIIGYAPGHYDPATRRYTVTGAEAHAWAEVWLPERGWVEYDPTPARQAGYNVVRLGNVPLPLAEPSGSSAWLWLTVSAVALLGAGGLLLLALVGRPRRTPPDAIGAWGAVQGRASRFGLRLPASATPGEQAAALVALLRSLSERLPARLRPPDPGALLSQLAATYSEARYGPHGPIPPPEGWRAILRALWLLLVRRLR